MLGSTELSYGSCPRRVRTEHPEVSSVLSSSPGFSAVGRFSLCGARALTSGHLSFLVPPCELVPSFLLAQPVRSAAELCVLDAAL